jgi:hypothetical protein
VAIAGTSARGAGGGTEGMTLGANAATAGAGIETGAAAGSTGARSVAGSSLGRFATGATSTGDSSTIVGARVEMRVAEAGRGVSAASRSSEASF